jgi:hypothetical protein
VVVLEVRARRDWWETSAGRVLREVGEAERAGLLVGVVLSAWFRLSRFFLRTIQTYLGFSETTRKQSLREKIFLYEDPSSGGGGTHL